VTPMFASTTYLARRDALNRALPSGIVLLPGNGEAPMNYLDNAYAYRQDSTFLYYIGLDRPDLDAAIDLDSGRTTVYGDEFTIDDIIWRGAQETIAGQARHAGIDDTAPRSALARDVTEALSRGRDVHVLPQYRAENLLRVASLLGVPAPAVEARASVPLIKAVVAQRSVKSAEEIEELRGAVSIAHDMHLLAMRQARPGRYEREVAGAMEGLVLERGGRVAFPIIFTTHGETLHNHAHHHQMKAGDLVVNDAGAESATHYTADITRTLPIGGRFTAVQRDMYQAVLRAQTDAIAAIRPGVPYRDVHLLAARRLAEDLRAMGCLRGDVDEAVAAGAHALFFPHGLGHMLGLDVHDLEALGEDHVGYDDTVRRSDQFGLRSLRLARALQPGFVLTVEPGLYFIPGLIDQWRAAGRCAEFVDYTTVERLRTAGGVRIEDNVAVTATGYEVLGPPIPKNLTDIEALLSGS
jgi:Xaa-Pro aminopeptidase